MKTFEEIRDDPETQRRLTGASQDFGAFFTDDQRDDFQSEFSISDQAVAVIDHLMRAARLRFLEDEKLAKRDLQKVRKELNRASRAAHALLQALQSMSEDTVHVLDDAGYGLRLAGQPYPRLAVDDAATSTTSAELKYKCRDTGEILTATLPNIEQLLSAFSEAIIAAKPMAGAGRKGRSNDDGIELLLFFIYHCWESILRRDFKLDWTEQSQPITEAARFAVYLSQLVDGAIPASRIAGGARKVQRKGIRINGLEDMDAAVEHFS